MEKLNEIKAIFFDLDGTLLDLKEKEFSAGYSKGIYNLFREYNEVEFFDYFWSSLEQMMKHNDPQKLVIDTFMKTFHEKSGMGKEEIKNRFMKFYEYDFNKLSKLGKSNNAEDVIKVAKNRGIKLILATNPVFPKIATETRCKWANISFDQFIHVTHAENSTICKPKPRYFEELVKVVDLPPENILMVGNHYLYDMAASAIGIKTWMIDINQDGIEYKNRFNVDFEGSIMELIYNINKI